MALISRNQTRPPSRFRLRLEGLEERCILSAGTLDPTFGVGGTVTTDLGATENVRATALQADGKIIAVGTSNNDFALTRYNSNGTLDTSFGSGGVVRTDVGGRTADRASGVAIQADGKIVVAGYTVLNNGAFDFAVVRYNVNGSIDTTFGGSKAKGKVVVNLGGSDRAWAVAIQADGKIVVAGDGGSYPMSGFAMIRLTTAGLLDTTFDGDGKVVTVINRSDVHGAYAVALQTDGKIVLAGDDGNSYLALARYNSNGSLDTSFDGDGKATFTAFGAWYCGVAVQTDGRIVVTTTALGTTETQAPALARVNPNGSLDTSFGSSGAMVFTSLGLNSQIHSLAIQSDGKIVAAGFRFDSTNGPVRLVTTRVNSDGTLDATFGTAGMVFTTFGGSTTPNWAVVLIQPDGKIVIAGGLDGNFAVERYLP